MRPRRVDISERRARLALRHRLALEARATEVTEAARSLVCLHATDPVTVYLSAWVRVESMAVAHLDRALYEDRSLIKHLAMRRTLFVFPREAIDYAQAGASNSVAARERRRLVRDVEAAGLQPDGERWLTRACEEVMEALSDGREAAWSELRKELPILAGSITYGEGKSWGGRLPVGPRVLTVLSAAGRLVRATNDGRWTISRPRWTAMSAWLGREIDPRPEAEGLAWLVAAWLQSFGPGTENDIKWWLGSTLGAVRRALSEIGAVEVDLEGQVGYLLPDDDDVPGDAVEPWAALLPPLDPTTMGWSHRDWYLGPHKSALFDRAGNAGPTVWWDGRIVGGWRQDDGGDVVVQLLEDVGNEAGDARAAEARRLSNWLDGTRILPRFPSPLWRAPR